MATNILIRSALILIVSTVTASALAAEAPTKKRTLTPDDIYRMEDVSGPRISPDGQWIAYLVGTSDRDADEERSVLWMVSWDGKQQVRLTNPASSVSSPRWSPDGRYLAYLAKPADAEHSQVMLLDRRGGEARPATSVSDDIESFAWSPDGQRMILVIQPTDEPKATEPKATGKAEPPPKPIVIDALHFKEDVSGYLGVGHEQHLFLFELATAKLEPLANDAGYNDVDPAWSPDGRQIAFVRTREKGNDPDGATDIELVEAHAGAAARQLTRPFAPNEQHLIWSPDGKLVAYLQGQEPKYNAYMQDQLVVIPAAGGTPRVLTSQLDRAVASYAFSADGAEITLLVEDDGSTYPARLNLADNTVTRLIASPIVVSAITTAGGRLAMAASTDTTASEVYAFEAGVPRRLTTHGEALLGVVQLGAVEDLRFKSGDGTEVHGLLVKPPGYVAGRKYPMILLIHGGPNGQDSHSVDFGSDQFWRQLLAANGYVVIGINYRGSSGRGFAFAKAIFADWGHKEVEDLLAGVDAVVARGIADPARLGIGGWSYGGILTDYTIASDRRFKAAFSGAGSGNQFAGYGSDQYILEYNSELGPPWRDPALWMKVSYPLLHADRIHTPTLFLGGSADFNVPITGGEQMYTALRTLGVPTQLVVYPDQYHEFTRPSFNKDVYERTAAWYAKYLSPTP